MIFKIKSLSFRVTPFGEHTVLDDFPLVIHVESLRYILKLFYKYECSFQHCISYFKFTHCIIYSY